MTGQSRAELPGVTTGVLHLDGDGPSRDVHGARAYVVQRVAQLASGGALDAGNGDVMDAWLERLRQKWHAHHASERSARVAAAEARIGGLEAQAVVEQQRADAAAEELQHTQRMLAEHERHFIEPAESRPNDRSERRRRARSTLDPLEGLVRPWPHAVLVVLLVLLAAAGDLATFNMTLSGFFTDSGPLILWTLTVAFAAASVGLMHGVGRALKNLRSARGGLGWPAIGLMVAAWIALGGVAVFFRVQTPTPTSSSDPFADPAAAAATAAHDALLSAVLLAGLFVASGVLAFYAGFSEHHPQMTDYLALRKRLPKQREEAARTAGIAVTARQALEHARTEAVRAQQSASDGIAAADAEIAELKELVRVEVAGHLGKPEATNGLTTDRPGTSMASNKRPDVADPRPVVPTPRQGSARTNEDDVRSISRTDFPPLGPPPP